MHVQTERLTLHLITPAEARRIVARAPGEGDHWHPEYPFEDELVPLAGLAKRDADDASNVTANSDDIFGLYMISTQADGLAVGGIGFFGPPDEHGGVEVGYGLVEAARGKGFATEALGALIALARDNGVATVRADTLATNPASQNVLLKNGFSETDRTAETIWYEKELS